MLKDSGVLSFRVVLDDGDGRRSLLQRSVTCKWNKRKWSLLEGELCPKKVFK
jgi:hypothetical protein